MEHWQSFRAECSCNGCKISTGCSVEGSSGTGMLNVVHCPVGIPGSSPLKVPREFSPFVQEKKRLSVQRAFHLYEGGTHEQRIK